MKKVKILTIVLAIVAITMIAFVGIYIPKQNRMENKLGVYNLATDLKGTRNIKLTVDNEKQTVIKDAEGNEVEQTEELTDEQITANGYTKEEVSSNKEEDLKVENYKATKKILEQRLKDIKVSFYTIKLDEETGTILIEIPENDSTDSIVTTLGTKGEFEIVDSETQEVLLSNQDIKLANVMYGTNSTSTTAKSGTMVYLNIEFTKEGSKKLEDISNQYKKVEESEQSTDENSTDETSTDETSTEETQTTTEQKEIILKIDDEEIMTTSFDEPITNGKLQMSIGSASTEQKTIQSYISQASNMAVVLDNGKLPVKYNVEENEYVLSDITQETLKIAAYSMAVIAVIALIILIIRYKIFGLLGSISYIGLISIFMILIQIQYINIIVSLQGILGIALILILNYIFINQLLAKLQKENNNKDTITKKLTETYKQFFINIIPLCIAVIGFCFMKWETINSFGIIMVWGIALIAIYHIIVTNALLRIKVSK